MLGTDRLDRAVPASVAPVPPLATAKEPVIPVERGSPVAFVSTSAEGVPKLGVTNTGLVAKTLLPDPVFVTLTICLDALRASAVDAVRLDRIRLLETVALEVVRFVMVADAAVSVVIFALVLVKKVVADTISVPLLTRISF